MRRLLLISLLLVLSAFNAQFTLTVNPPVETVFDNGGQPWPVTNLVAAIDYDNGGQGVGFSAVARSDSICQQNGSSVRPDYFNFKTSPWTAQPSIPFILCGGTTLPPGGEIHNTQISVATAGSYTITLYTVNATGGAVWDINVDGVLATPVTLNGGGDFSTVVATVSPAFNISAGTHKLSIIGVSGDPTGHYIGDFAGWQGTSLAPPPQAVAAGFTTSALNADFSQSQYALTSNWLDCSGGNDGTKLWHQNTGFLHIVNMPPCSFPQVTDTDPATGQPVTVIDSHFETNYGNPCNCTQNLQELTTYQTNAATTTNYPMGYYETRFRFTGSVSNSYGASWFTNFTNSSSRGEWDDIEINSTCCGGGPSSNWHNWAIADGCGGGELCGTFWNPASFGTSCGGSPDPTKYHTYGLLMTTDAATKITITAYLDNCQVPNSQTTFLVSRGDIFSGQWNDRNAPIIAQGFACGSLPCTPTAQQHQYIQWYRVWSCANWASQHC